MLTRNNADPAHAMRPFDAARDGFALSEGAAMVVLEDEDVAVRRGAHILAYLDGYGASFNRAPVAHAAANEIDAGRAMQEALIKWDLTLQGEIDVIFANAGGNMLDAIEGKAIRRVWGPNTDRLWVTSIKGALGHTLGASGAMSLDRGDLLAAGGTDPADAQTSSGRIRSAAIWRSSRTRCAGCTARRRW